MSIMSGFCSPTSPNVLVELSPSTSSINASSDIWLTSSKVNSNSGCSKMNSEVVAQILHRLLFALLEKKQKYVSVVH